MFERVLDKIARIIGLITIGILLALLLITGFVKVEQAIRYPSLSSGVVTAFSYDDGHPTYTSWKFGRYSFRKELGDGQQHYYLAVSDNKGHTDFWEVGIDDYYVVNIGQSVYRKDFN